MSHSSLPPWLPDCRKVVQEIRSSSRFPLHGLLPSFFDRLERWIVSGRKSHDLPFVFDPLFQKAAEILYKLNLNASIANNGIGSFEAFQSEINRALVIHNDNTPEYVSCLKNTVGYGSLESYDALSLLYIYYIGTITCLYDIIHRRKINAGRIPWNGPFAVHLEDDHWPWPIRTRGISRPSASCIEYSGGYYVPLSWRTATWFLEECLYIYRLRSFEDNDTNSTLTKIVDLQDRIFIHPEDKDILLSRLSKNLSAWITSIMAVDEQSVEYTFDCKPSAEKWCLLRMALANVSFADFMLDATVNSVIPLIWKRLRGKAEKSLDCSFDTLRTVNSFIERWSECARNDKDFRRVLRGIEDDIHPTRSQEDIVQEHKSIMKKLNNWRSEEFGVVKGRPKGVTEPSNEAISLIKKSRNDMSDVYKCIKKYKHDHPFATDNEIAKTLSKRKTWKNVPSEYLEKLVAMYSNKERAADNSKLKERAMAAMLSRFVELSLREDLPEDAVRRVLSPPA